MFSFDKLPRIFAELQAFRGNGQGAILFDPRDPGNYGAYDWPVTEAMLRKTDPTGLAVAMMVNEMLEATIVGSNVRLSRVLREPGFIAQLQTLLALKADLMTDLERPLAALLARLTVALGKISADFGEPTSREATVCLRDALYCLDSGLTMRWLQCSQAPATNGLPLCPEIRQFDDLVGFTETLRQALPLGAHLARIGSGQTAIGLKQPGRIAYLSSLKIDTQTGKMAEGHTRDSHMAERFDLDTAVHRYPQWIRYVTHNAGSYCEPVGADAHTIRQIADLPRDRLLWLAMVVEMAGQRMAAAEPAAVGLTEVLALADKTVVPRTALVPIRSVPNWVVQPLSLEAMFDSLQFSPWERAYLRPALDGLSADLFLPIGEDAPTIVMDTRERGAWRLPGGDDAMAYGARQALNHKSVRLISVSPSLVGTHAEVEAARKAVFGANLAAYLLAWGNRRFQEQWLECKPWFKKRLEGRLSQVLTASCVRLMPADFKSAAGMNFYKQSTRHKTYNPRCVFDGKSAVTTVAHLYPRSSAELVELLGLSNESKLPEFLRGWSREMSWATLKLPTATATPAGELISRAPPYSTTAHWLFGRVMIGERMEAILEATVAFNQNNVATLLGKKSDE